MYVRYFEILQLSVLKFLQRLPIKIKILYNSTYSDSLVYYDLSTTLAVFEELEIFIIELFKTVVFLGIYSALLRRIGILPAT